ncbi:MAG TPA: hypothetical protein PLH23_12880 [Hyphomonadaceae bacterium]|nr:hypothetical protein [Hyphomonadaceae bacterium]
MKERIGNRFGRAEFATVDMALAEADEGVNMLGLDGQRCAEFAHGAGDVARPEQRPAIRRQLIRLSGAHDDLPASLGSRS